MFIIDDDNVRKNLADIRGYQKVQEGDLYYVRVTWPDHTESNLVADHISEEGIDDTLKILDEEFAPVDIRDWYKDIYENAPEPNLDRLDWYLIPLYILAGVLLGITLTISFNWRW